MTLLADNKKINLLRDFLGISHWQSLVAILIFFTIIIALSITIKKTRLKFPYRIFIGMGLGLIFGLTIQGITGFNPNNITNPLLSGGETQNTHYIEWAGETARWVELIKNIFITGITMLTVPIVFLAIARITAKKLASTNQLMKVSITGIVILLVNVAIAFCIAFGLGMAFKIGQNFHLSESGTYTRDSVKGIPALIADYIPSSFIGVFTQFLIIPVIILGFLVGYAIKKLTKRNEQRMDKARSVLETMWKIITSILTMFVKIMPFAVMSMLASAIMNYPIGALADIGIIIGVAYLALVITFAWHLLSLFIFGVNPWRWLKKAQRPIISGFTTQSSSATLPIALDTLKNNLKIKEEAADTVMPLSTTIGLSGCAGVQAGIILSFLYFSVIKQGDFPDWTIALLFINGLIVTLIASLGIAGVPGTASVVTAGVLGGLGFGAFYASVYGIIGALDGLFDMGRTAVNISGGLQATAIASRNNDMIEDEKLKLKNYLFKPLHILNKKLGAKIAVRKAKENEINNLKKAYEAKIAVLKKARDNKIQAINDSDQNITPNRNIDIDIANVKTDYQEQVKTLKLEMKAKIKAIKKQKNNNQNNNEH